MEGRVIRLHIYAKCKFYTYSVEFKYKCCFVSVTVTDGDEPLNVPLEDVIVLNNKEEALDILRNDAVLIGFDIEEQDGANYVFPKYSEKVVEVEEAGYHGKNSYLLRGRNGMHAIVDIVPKVWMRMDAPEIKL